MKAIWLIDGAYLYKSMKSFQAANPQFASKGIDYARLKNEIVNALHASSIDSFYFNATPDQATDGQNNFYSWLKSPESFGGPNIKVKLYTLKERSVECPSCKERFAILAQKGVDVGIATTALKRYSHYDALVFSTGDGDFEDAIRFLKEDNGKKVYVAGFEGSISPDIAQHASEVLYLNRRYAAICDKRQQDSSPSFDKRQKNAS